MRNVPHPEMFESFDHDTGGIIRQVEIEAMEGSLHEYRERTLLRTPDGSVRYQDQFQIRNWTMEETLGALESAGFVPAGDLSARFAGLGADYLLMRRSS